MFSLVKTSKGANWNMENAEINISQITNLNIKPVVNKYVTVDFVRVMRVITLEATSVMRKAAIMRQTRLETSRKKMQKIKMLILTTMRAACTSIA
jgi:hypothetical protein